MPPRRHIAWIACLAVLFNLLAMPLSCAAPKSPTQQLLWGAFCSSTTGKAKADLQALAKIDLGQQHDEHAQVQHCWCCLGGPPALALSSQPAQVRGPPSHSQVHAPPPLASQPTPRQLWPALNPRASPLV